MCSNLTWHVTVTGYLHFQNVLPQNICMMCAAPVSVSISSISTSVSSIKSYLHTCSKEIHVPFLLCTLLLLSFVHFVYEIRVVRVCSHLFLKIHERWEDHYQPPSMAYAGAIAEWGWFTLVHMSCNVCIYLIIIHICTTGTCVQTFYCFKDRPKNTYNLL